MKRRRHTPEQVIRKRREADRMLAEGKTTVEVARHLEVSENTYHRWRNQFGGMKVDDVLPSTRARRGLSDEVCVVVVIDQDGDGPAARS